MANRFWVGGAGTWDAVSTTHWSALSGGASGASAPGSSDNVVFDGSSGAGTVTLSFAAAISSLTCTGFTGTLTGTSQSIQTGTGVCTLAAGMTLSGSITFIAGSGTPAVGNLTTAGKTLFALNCCNAGSFQLQDDLTVVTLQLQSGTQAKLDANGKNVTVTGSLTTDINNTSQLLMGSGTWTFSGTGTVCDFTGIHGGGSLTITGSSATIKLTDATSASKTVKGANNTFGTIWCSGAGTGTFIIQNATFTLKDDGSSAHTTQLDLGTGTATIGATLSSSGSLELVSGTLSANGHDVTLASFKADVGAVAMPTMGVGTWTLTGSGTAWDISAATVMTFSGASATIKLTDATSASKTVKGGSKTYGTIWCSGAGTGLFTIQNATFTFKDDGSGAHNTILDPGASGVVSLGAALNNSLLNLNPISGTFNAAGFAVTVASFVAGASLLALTMGAVTWTLTSSGTVWDLSAAASLALTVTGSTIRLNDASAASKTFKGGGKTYNNLQLTGAGTGAFIITGSNTFATFTLDTPPHTVQFADGSTQIATTWSFSGSAAAGNNILESQSGSGTWDIVCTAGVTASYLTLQGSHAHGGTFTADNSFDAGDNLFWVFVRSASDAVYFDSAYTYSGASISTVSGLNWLWGETVGVLADGVDIGDATVTTHGNLTLPGGISASVISLGKRYTSYGKTLRAPQAGNQDGSALGRQMKITTVAADMLNSSGLYVGTPTGTRPIPPAWKQTNDGDLYTGIFPAPIDDSSRNEGVIIFSTDRGYPCTLRALEFGIEGTP